MSVKDFTSAVIAEFPVGFTNELAWSASFVYILNRTTVRLRDIMILLERQMINAIVVRVNNHFCVIIEVTLVKTDVFTVDDNRDLLDDNDTRRHYLPIKCIGL